MDSGHSGWTLNEILFGAYLVALSSLSTQFLVNYLHINIPLIGVTQLLVILAFFLSGSHFRLLETVFAKYYVGLGVWWMVACVFSYYRRGSFNVLLNYYTRLYIIPFLFTAIITTPNQVRRLMYCFGWGYVLIVLYCFKIGSVSEDGRFIVPSTTLANPNDLALHLMLGASFIMVLFSGKFTRIVALGILPILANFVLKTGSRANLLTIALVFVMSLKILPARRRVSLITGAVLSVFLVVPFVSKSTLARLTTFFDIGGSDYEYASRAVGSTEARKELQRKGVIMTLQNPLFGVGPGQFAIAVEEWVQGTMHTKSTWQGTHNTYLEVSAESGFPGLICFAACVFLCIRTNYRDYKLCQAHPVLGEYSLNCYALLVGSVVYAFGILFCHIAYDYHVPILIGFTAANDGALRRLLQQSQAAAGPLVAKAPAAPRFRTSSTQRVRQSS